MASSSPAMYEFMGAVMGLIGGIVEAVADTINAFAINGTQVAYLTNGIFANDTQGVGLIYWIKYDIIFILNNFGDPLAAFLRSLLG